MRSIAERLAECGLTMHPESVNVSPKSAVLRSTQGPPSGDTAIQTKLLTKFPV